MIHHGMVGCISVSSLGDDDAACIMCMAQVFKWTDKLALSEGQWQLGV